MRRILLLIRKVVVPLIGFPVILIGIILLPLPGPGVLVILAGLLILSIEYEWAKRHHQRLRALMRKSLKRIRPGSNKVIVLLASLDLLAAFGHSQNALI